MSAELKVIDPSVLSEQERADLTANIDALIAAHKNNRQEINRLVFESVSAMTTGEDYERELASKKGLRRFIGGITGSNKKLQDKINSSRSAAQYASQLTLQRLAEQNLMSFDLITAVNNKLNASVLAIEGEINEIYDRLLVFFKQSRSDVIQLENRVERLEKNVNLLNWQNSIEYQMFNGIEYSELDDISKIVCLAHDFYEITQGKWTASDLLLLKVAMNTIAVQPKEKTSYFDFVKKLSSDKQLMCYLLNGDSILKRPEPYLISLCGINKIELLNKSEHYVVDTVLDILNESSVVIDSHTACEELTRRYLESENEIKLDAQVENYDLALAILFELYQARANGVLGPADEKIEELIEECSEQVVEEKYQYAAKLFKECKFKEAHPLLEELSAKGYAKADALLYWLFLDGYEGNITNESESKMHAKKGFQAGDAISAMQYALFCVDTSEEKLRICEEYKPRLKELANDGDTFAIYMLGLCFINDTDEPTDYLQAMQCFRKAAALGFYRAFDSIAVRYQKGEGVDKSEANAIAWCEMAILFPYGRAYHRLACLYENTDIKRAIPLFFKAAELGCVDAYGDVAAVYSIEEYAKIAGVSTNLEKELYYATEGAKRGNALAAYNAGCAYMRLNDLKESEKWFRISAERGYKSAAEMLENYFNG